MSGAVTELIEDGGEEYRRRFEESLLPHLPAMHRVAVKLTGDPTAAEDLVQEAYLRAHKSFGTLRDTTRARAWLCRIVARLAIDRHRRADREVLVENPEELDRFSVYELVWDEDPDPYSDTPHDDLLARFRDDEVRAALEALPVEYRVPLVLLYAAESDCTYRDLAEMLGCPIGTVMSRLHRGRKILERELWECALRRGMVKTWNPNR